MAAKTVIRSIERKSGTLTVLVVFLALVCHMLQMNAMSDQDDGKEFEDQSSGDEALTNAESYLKKACDILKRETVRLRKEQESMATLSKKLESVHFPSTVKLNVGGQYFTTALQTLTKDPNSMLAGMFSGKFEVKPSEDGSFFIDRDGKHFRFILNYLRTGKLTLGKFVDNTFLKELEEEAEFFQLQGLPEELRHKRLQLETLVDSLLSKYKDDAVKQELEALAMRIRKP